MTSYGTTLAQINMSADSSMTTTMKADSTLLKNVKTVANTKESWILPSLFIVAGTLLVFLLYNLRSRPQ